MPGVVVRAMSEFLHRARVDNLQQRYPYATEEQITHALTVENGHAGRAGMLLAQLSPEKNEGSADPRHTSASGPAVISLSFPRGLHGAVACVCREAHVAYVRRGQAQPSEGPYVRRGAPACGQGATRVRRAAQG